MTERLYFEKVMAHRGTYFVEYQPPAGNCNFAVLNLFFLEDIAADDVWKQKEVEAKIWLKRYPVPMMIFSSDEKNDLFYDASGSSCLMGWQCDSEAEIIFTSRMEEFDQFLEVYCPPEDWRCIFTDIPVRTDSEVKASARKNFHEQARSIKLLKIFLLIWIVGLPTSVMLLVFFGPEWLGMIALALALIESARASLRLWGAYQPSKREQEANELQRRKDHYYFHCEKNPDGFLRLRNENFERDAKEEIRFESEKLKALTDKKAEDFRE